MGKISVRFQEPCDSSKKILCIPVRRREESMQAQSLPDRREGLLKSVKEVVTKQIGCLLCAGKMTKYRREEFLR